jgi:recombination protein RecT
MARTNKDEREAEQAAATAVVQQPAQAEGATNAVARVRGMLEQRGGELDAALRTFGIERERFISVALSQFSRRPELWNCEPLSVYRAMKEAADYGLEPTGSIGGAHLVPYGTQCTLLIDYRGLVRMVRRSGEVARVEARVVLEHDAFRFAYGLEPYLEHVPSLELDPGSLVRVYAVAIFRDGERQFDVMSAAEVDAIRQRSRAGRAGPWVTDYFEMAKKTVLRRLCKLLPLDDVTRTALAAEDEREGEARGLEQAGAIVSRQSQLRQQIAARVAPEAIDEQPAQIEVVPGQLTIEDVPAPVDNAVDEQPPAPPEPPRLVGEPTAQRAACGASVAGPEGSAFTCVLAAGHRGEHTDGQHDWPQAKG